MIKLTIICEAMLTNTQGKKILQKKLIGWDKDIPIATIFDLPIRMVSAKLQKEDDLNCGSCKGKGYTGSPPVTCRKCNGTGEDRNG